MKSFVKALFKRYSQDNLTGKSAALAYFAIFSIGPLLFIVLGVLGFVLDSDVYRERLLEEVGAMTGPGAVDAVEKLAANKYLSDSAGIAIMVGLGGLVLAAIGVFGQLQRSLNDIFGVKVGPSVGLRAIITQKIISLALVGLAALLLVASVVTSVILSAVNRAVEFGSYYFLITFTDFIVSAAIFAVLLALIYRILPDVKLPWRIIFSAAAIVALLFTLGTLILSMIISNNATVSAFGAAGSVVALLIWIYYSGLIIYLGASGISVYAQSRSIKMVPRYSGVGGVVRIQYKEEPLTLPIVKKAKKNFKKGIKKGWNK